MTIQQQNPANSSNSYDLNTGSTTNQMNFQFDATATYNVNNMNPAMSSGRPMYPVGGDSFVNEHNTFAPSFPSLNTYNQQQQQQQYHPQQTVPPHVMQQQQQQQNLQLQNAADFVPNNVKQTMATVLCAAYINTAPSYQAANANLSNNSNLTSFQMNQMLNYQSQQQYQMHNYQQNVFRQQQQQQQQQQHQQQHMYQTPSENIDATCMNYLKAAFRVGMLGLEALPRRVDGSYQIKYRQSPTYADDVKWLWEVAIKLDFYQKSSANLQQFCQTAATVLQNPFLIQEIAFDSANYLCRNNPSQISMTLCMPMLNVLVQRCIGL